MGRYVIMIVLFLQAMICNGQSSVGESTMSFDQPVHDFGTIREQDGSVNYTFEFTNAGTKPFVIENVAVSCGCTTPSYSKAPVMPGKKGTINISFDPLGRPGEFLKEIVVTSNNRANRNIIKIKGTVTPRPRTIEDDYPVELTSGVRISTLNLNFRYVAQSKNSSMSVGLANTSSKNVDVSVATVPASPSYLTVTQPKSICAGCKTEMTVTYDFGKEDSWGVKSDQIYLTVNGVRQQVPISATAVFVDNFAANTQQQMENAPRIKFDTQYYNFGDVKSGTKLVREFTLTNGGELPLIIRAVEPSKGVSASLRSGTTIAPMQSVKMKVTLDEVALGKGKITRSVVLITNDPTRPMREIRLAATIL